MCTLPSTSRAGRWYQLVKACAKRLMHGGGSSTDPTVINLLAAMPNGLVARFQR
jgi:hypothetical protein